MFRKNCLILLLVLAWFDQSIYLMGQDSLKVYELEDFVEVSKTKKQFLKNYFKEGYPDPKKAITLAIIPGMGQIYNKKYWKLPFVYGALGGVIYLIDRNTSRYRILRDAYASRLDDNIENDLLPSIPATALRAGRDDFDKNRQLSWIGLIAFYLISAGDAFVDAHLKDFNVDNNISIVPAIQTDPFQANTIGLSVQIKLSK